MPTQDRPGLAGPRPAEVSDGPGQVSLALRAPVFAVSTVLLSVAAHVAGGGAAPDLLTLVLLAVGVDVTFRALARRELALMKIVIGVGLAQGILHQLMVAGIGGQVAGASSLHTAHAHTAGPPFAATVLAHGAAALLVAWWLRCGEAAAWRAARRAVRPLLRTRRPSPVSCRPVLRITATSPRPALPQAVVLATSPHRGPPLTA